MSSFHSLQHMVWQRVVCKEDKILITTSI